MKSILSFITEKLKISKPTTTTINTTLRQLAAWYNEQRVWDVDRTSLMGMYFEKSDKFKYQNDIVDFVYPALNVEIDIEEESTPSDSIYTFEIKGETFVVNARVPERNKFSNSKYAKPEGIYEKLKVRKQSDAPEGSIEITLKKFVNWYTGCDLDGDIEWDAIPEMANALEDNALDTYFDDSISNFEDFIEDNQDRTIYVVEERTGSYIECRYRLFIDEMEFSIMAYINSTNELLSKNLK